MFLPDRGGRPASGLTDAQGNYRLTTYQPMDGALVGKHRVTITKQELPSLPETPSGSPSPTPPDSSDPHWLTPERYARAETSGLMAEVKPGTNQFDFELTP